MKPRDRALRAQDVQSALQGLVQAPVLVTAELEVTQISGMACRLAVHVRGAEVYEGHDEILRLKVVAEGLGIPVLQLGNVLALMEEAELVRVRRTTGDALDRVQEFVPEYGDLYRRVGEVYEAKDRTEVEDALVETVDQLVSGPVVASPSIPVLALNDRARDLLLDTADQSGLIRSIASKKLGADVLFSPQYWDEHGHELPGIVETYGDEAVRDVVAAVRQNQGLTIPGSLDRRPQSVLLRQLAHSGVLPSPSVDSLAGVRAFAFTPFVIESDDRAVEAKVLEKTRAVLACVRYGEGFGTITRVRDPIRLLTVLLDRGHVGPHSEILRQYKTLVEHGVCRVARSNSDSSRFILHLIDNPENKRSLRAAISLIQEGVPYEASHVDATIQSMAQLPGDYIVPPTARSRRVYHAEGRALASLTTGLIDAIVTE